MCLPFHRSIRHQFDFYYDNKINPYFRGMLNCLRRVSANGARPVGLLL